MLLPILAACHKDDPLVRHAPLGFVSTASGSTTSPGTTTSTPATFPTTPTHTVPDGDPWSAVPTPPMLSSSVLAAVADDIDAIVASTSATTGVYVQDYENGQVVYAYDEDGPKTPASNTKLFTTGVAFDELGQDHRFEVTAYGDALPDASGAVDTVTLVGEHDFTWSTFFYESSSFPAERLADRLWDAGVRAIGQVVVSGEYEVEGYELGYLDTDYYRAAAADTVWTAFEDRGIAVADVTTSTSLVPPAGAVELASRASPPLSTSCHPLLVYSHNEFADLLALHNGWELAGEDSWDAGAAEVAAWLAGAGIDTAGFHLEDGSGLSHGNTVTPRQVVETEAYLFGRPAGLAWQRDFSTAGYLGTLSSRMTGGDTAGRFLGKTGTLYGVIATSGVLYHRYDGHRYLISVLMNDVSDDTYARSLEDDVVEAVARDLRGLGDRPARPDLQAVRAPGDGTLVADWSEVADADAYVVWLSTDGEIWDRGQARLVDQPPFVIGGLPEDSVEYVRVTAVNGAGESDPSDVLAGRSAFEPPTVLLVDADARWPTQFEDPMGRGHDFLVAHAAALGDRTFESVASALVADGTVDLRDYAVVDWQTGEESAVDETFSDAEQVAVADAVDAGTALLASGAEIGWDLGELGYPSDVSFLEDVLGVTFVGDDADTYSLYPTAGGLLDGVGELGFYTPGTQDVQYPDQLAPTGGGQPLLSYLGGAGGTAGAVRADGRVVVLGFPFEALDTPDVRADVMERILDSFGG